MIVKKRLTGSAITKFISRGGCAGGINVYGDNGGEVGIQVAIN